MGQEIDRMQHQNQREISNPFHGEISKMEDMKRILNVHAARTDFRVKVHQFISFRLSIHFTIEMSVKRLSYFLKISVLYVVYCSISI